MYDGVDAAVSLLAQADLAGGSVIVMSDGADTGATPGSRGRGPRARARGCGSFRSASSPAPSGRTRCSQLASDSRGQYSEAGRAGDLARSTTALGAELRTSTSCTTGRLQDPSPRVRCASRSTASAPPPRLPLARGARSSPRRRTSATTSGAPPLACAGEPGGRWPGGPRPHDACCPARAAPADRAPGDVRSPRAPMPPERPSEYRGPRLLPGLERGLARVRGWAAFEEELDIARIDDSGSPVSPPSRPLRPCSCWLLAPCPGSRCSALIGLIAVPFGVRVVSWRWPTSSADASTSSSPTTFR